MTNCILKYISKYFVMIVFKIHCKILKMYLNYYLKYMYFKILRITADGTCIWWFSLSRLYRHVLGRLHWSRFYEYCTVFMNLNTVDYFLPAIHRERSSKRAYINLLMKPRFIIISFLKATNELYCNVHLFNQCMWRNALHIWSVD